jgi:hypothetical protein
MFHTLDSNILTTTAYGVYISQLIHYARAYSLYLYFLGHRILNTKLLNRGFKDSSYLSKKFFFFKVFCQLRTDDERWYWQLDFGSKLTIVSRLCHTMVLFTI